MELSDAVEWNGINPYVMELNGKMKGGGKEEVPCRFF